MYYFRFSGTSFDDREEWLKPDLPFIGSLKDALAEAEARCGEWEKELWKKDDFPSGVIAIGTRKGHPKQFVKFPDDGEMNELIEKYTLDGSLCPVPEDDEYIPDGSLYPFSEEENEGYFSEYPFSEKEEYEGYFSEYSFSEEENEEYF